MFLFLQVQVLVLSDPHLVRTSCDKHSPLHLSARNGHVTVIETLIDFGMQVNLMVSFLLLEVLEIVGSDHKLFKSE